MEPLDYRSLGNFAQLKVQIALKNLIWAGNMQIFSTEMQEGQRFKKSLLALILLLGDCVWV